MFLISFSGLLRGCFRKAKCVLIVRYLSANMNADRVFSYEEAVYALNGLQSNAAVLQKAREERDVNAYRNLINTEKHLKTLGIQIDDLNSLNIVHVSGTKGKGSTCAFTESVLRKHGYKTGFYSSPHLISVNERIRINGLPLNKDLFVKYFWEVYNPIYESLKNGEKMPPYFMFLTVMAFYVFLKEKVQAAVIEVGIGGLYDCTNIIKKPVVVGITSLGIDHVHILGSTLAEIAIHKAGIFKTGVSAFTVPQHETAMKVLCKKAQEVGCLLQLAPPLEVYEQDIDLGISGMVQNINASLALQLSAVWLKKVSGSSCFLDMVNSVDISVDCINSCPFTAKMAAPITINNKILEALRSCVWPGRFQVVKKDDLNFYLDGAHTQQSVKYCVKWFEQACEIHKMEVQNGMQSSALRVLIFNCTGERKAESMLESLIDVNFDLVIFTPNRKTVTKDSASDQSNFMVDPEKEMQQCIINREIWCHLKRSLYENALNIASQTNSSYTTKSVCQDTQLYTDNTLLFCCLSNAVNWLLHKKPFNDCPYCSQSREYSHMLQETKDVQVLVTGSLHLVGGVLALIDT